MNDQENQDTIYFFIGSFKKEFNRFQDFVYFVVEKMNHNILVLVKEVEEQKKEIEELQEQLYKLRQKTN